MEAGETKQTTYPSTYTTTEAGVILRITTLGMVAMATHTIGAVDLALDSAGAGVATIHLGTLGMAVGDTRITHTIIRTILTIQTTVTAIEL